MDRIIRKNNKSEKNKKIQWHPAFCSAIRLELVANKGDLEYNSEYGLNTKPIQIDLLVIKKLQNAYIENDIGRIFRTHNIIEYKSPQDELNIDTFFKVMAYACLYKARGKTVDAIKLEEITMTFIRKGKPQSLFKQLMKYGITIEEKKNGIYYIDSGFIFEIQIIVTKELDDGHVWLTSLADNITERKAEELVDRVVSLTQKDDKEYADSVLQVAMQSNKEVFDRIKGADVMCEALMELMKPEFDAALEKQVAIEVEKQVKERIETQVKEQVEAQVAKATADKDARIRELEAKLAAAGIE